MVDLTESPAKRHLRLWGQAETGKHQHAIVFQRVQDGGAEHIVSCQHVGIQARHLRADRCGELVDGQDTHSSRSVLMAPAR
jgi:hypothetical protein